MFDKKKYVVHVVLKMIISRLHNEINVFLTFSLSACLFLSLFLFHAPKLDLFYNIFNIEDAFL